ncbi:MULTISPECIES: hypothetical protein [Kitasatospora]|uniref:Uncharacterized protein n=1 Tax=Kitasatospora arboriphila TaxID=258052 RepID=A0ABN1TYE5_9ACTN
MTLSVGGRRLLPAAGPLALALFSAARDQAATATGTATPPPTLTTGACGWDVSASPAPSGETARCNDGTAS